MHSLSLKESLKESFSILQIKILLFNPQDAFGLSSLTEVRASSVQFLFRQSALGSAQLSLDSRPGKTEREIERPTSRL